MFSCDCYRVFLVKLLGSGVTDMESSSATSDNPLPQWENLQIGEEEIQTVTMEEDGPEVEDSFSNLCLVGRLLTERPMDFTALKRVMASLWRPVKGMFVKELDANRYMFQFFHELDIKRVEEGTPWTFN